MRQVSRRSVLSRVGALVALAAAGRAARRAYAQTATPRFLRIATGPTESSLFAIGTLLGNVVSSPPGARECERGGSCGVPGLIAVTQSTAGALANVDLIGRKQLESGLCQADIAHWAFHGTGPYRRNGAVRNLRAIANLYPESLHIVVHRDAGIADLRRLKGKLVAMGEQDSGTLASARAILQAVGLSERDVRAQYLKPAQAADALRDRAIDALFEMAGAPASTIAELAAKTEVTLLPIDDAIVSRLRGANPYFATTTIPAETYKGIGAVQSISVGVLWLVGAEVDEQIVHGLTRALFHPNNRRILDAGHPFARRIRQETALDGVALQLHPGAALYYLEAGLIN